MTSVRELLRESDPVRHEAPITAADREHARRTLIARAGGVAELPLGRLPRRAIAGLVLLLGGAMLMGGYGLWPRGDATVHAAVRFEVRLAEHQPAPGLRPAVVRGSDQVVHLHEDVVASNGDVKEGRVAAAEGGRFAIHITLNTAAADRLRRATSGHIGRPLAILIDGEVATAPVVRSAIGDTAVISGHYTREEAKRIAEGIPRR